MEFSSYCFTLDTASSMEFSSYCFTLDTASSMEFSSYCFTLDTVSSMEFYFLLFHTRHSQQYGVFLWVFVLAWRTGLKGSFCMFWWWNRTACFLSFWPLLVVNVCNWECFVFRGGHISDDTKTWSLMCDSCACVKELTPVETCLHNIL